VLLVRASAVPKPGPLACPLVARREARWAAAKSSVDLRVKRSVHGLSVRVPESSIWLVMRRAKYRKEGKSATRAAALRASHSRCDRRRGRCFPSAAFAQNGDLSRETLHWVKNPEESLSVVNTKQFTEFAVRTRLHSGGVVPREAGSVRGSAWGSRPAFRRGLAVLVQGPSELVIMRLSRATLSPAASGRAIGAPLARFRGRASCTRGDHAGSQWSDLVLVHREILHDLQESGVYGQTDPRSATRHQSFGCGCSKKHVCFEWRDWVPLYSQRLPCACQMIDGHFLPRGRVARNCLQLQAK
jgi:hypothetical protein